MSERNFKAELLNSLVKLGDFAAFMEIDNKFLSTADVANEVESDSEIGKKIVSAFQHAISKDEVFQNVKRKKNEAELDSEEKLLVNLMTGISAAMLAKIEGSEGDPHAKRMTIRYPENDK